MKYSNSLTSHHPERSNSPANKMSGWISKIKNKSKHTSYKKQKLASIRKTRRFLNNPKFFDKI